MLNRTILVVDDAPVVLQHFDDVLTSAGFAVESCIYPTDALDRCRRWPGKYGLVFIDIHFPEGPVGYNVSRQISNINGPSFPIIIGMTGLKSLYDYLGRAEYGMRDVLLKPVNDNLLVSLATAYVPM